MSKIVVDGEPVDASSLTDRPLTDVFRAIQSRIHDSGRVVTEIFVDGQEVRWDDGSDAWDRPLAGETEFRLHTDLPIALSSRLLGKLEQMLPAVSGDLLDAATRLRDQPNRGYLATRDVLPRWAEVQQATALVAEFHGLTMTEEPWHEIRRRLDDHVRQLESQLREAKEALELEDGRLLADLVEFDMVPLADEWTATTKRYRELLEAELPQDSP